MKDQAEKLRFIALSLKKQIEEEIQAEMERARTAKRARVIVITSGKGGVGKSTVALNMALAFCTQGKKVVLVDADLGLANIDIMLGVMPQYNLHHMVLGKRSLQEIIITGPNDLKIIPGGSGIEDLANLDQGEINKVIMELGKLDNEFDYMIIDTGAGISKSVLSFVLAADDVVLITTPEPTAITDAYSVLKNISQNSPERKLFLIVNRVADSREGQLVAENLQQLCHKFLGLHMEPLGYIMDEPLVGEGIRRQQPFINVFPRSEAAGQIGEIVRKMLAENDEAMVEQNNRERGIKNFFKKFWQAFAK